MRPIRPRSRLRRALVSGCLAGVLLAPACVTLAAPAGAVERTVSEEAQRGLTLTIYGNGLALVHDRRWVPLVAGRNTLQIEGLSPQLLLGSLRLYSSETGVEPVARSSRPADLTPRRLLEAHVGRRVLYVTEDPQTGEARVRPATLLSLEGGVVLEVDGRVELNPPGRIALDAMGEPAEGLRAEPSLTVVVDSAEARPTELTLGYLTEGLGWQADYVADLAPDGSLDLVANVTLANHLPVAFPYAEVRLVAGEVSRERAEAPAPIMARAEAMALDQAAGAAPPPREVGDRYLYALDGELGLAAGERKQATLFRLDDVPAERHYRFEGLAGLGGPDEVGPVQAGLELRFDTPEGEAERPFPAGTIRVYETLDLEDGGGSDRPLFAGEDRVPHIPAGGEVTLTLGRAFDVTAMARRTGYERLGDRSFEQAQEIVVRNAKSEPVEVEIVGRFPRGTEIVEESAPHTQTTAERLTWTLTVPAEGETTLTYTARVQN
jgi:hypothetical protein